MDREEEDWGGGRRRRDRLQSGGPGWEGKDGKICSQQFPKRMIKKLEEASLMPPHVCLSKVLDLHRNCNNKVL